MLHAECNAVRHVSNEHGREETVLFFEQRLERRVQQFEHEHVIVGRNAARLARRLVRVTFEFDHIRNYGRN